MNKVLNENDIRVDKDIIIVNAINSHYISGIFKRLIKYLSGKTGYGDSYVNFHFWDELDDYDKGLYDAPYNGVEVDFLDDTQQYSLQDLYYYVNLAAQRYIEFKQYDKDEIDEVLDQMKCNFGV